MSRQSPNRNQRSKGIKIKHVLQICLLVAICFWLIYQVKHSHDRKKEFDESGEKVLLRRESSEDMIKLGRKDIWPQVEEIVSKNEEHDEELEEEEEEDKNEEDERGEKKIRRNENEGQGGEEEEIDEHERDELETEIDREEDFVDDEEREASDDKENDSEDSKKEVSVEDVDRDGDDRSTHEAREEHYKADDASSAVSHDTQIDRENSSEHLDLVLGKDKKEHNSEETNTSENRKESGVENGEMAKGSNGSDVTIKETLLGNSQNGSFSNNTVAEGSHHRSKVNNSSTEERLGKRDSSFVNITESISDNSINSSISTISAETEGVDSKSEFSSTSNDTDSSESVKTNISEASLDTGGGKNEIFDSRMPEIFEEVQRDPIAFSDTSNSLENKDVPANLDTLLHGIWDKGTHTKDAASG